MLIRIKPFFWEEKTLADPNERWYSHVGTAAARTKISNYVDLYIRVPPPREFSDSHRQPKTFLSKKIEPSAIKKVLNVYHLFKTEEPKRFNGPPLSNPFVRYDSKDFLCSGILNGSATRKKNVQWCPPHGWFWIESPKKEKEESYIETTFFWYQCINF